jgi:hypothetical protein
MFRYGCLLFLILIFVAPAQNQAPSLPLIYVAGDGSNQYFYILDISTGEILYRFENEGDNCPSRLSDNRRWLLFWQTNEAESMLDIISGERQSLGNTNINDVKWSSGYNFVAYYYNYVDGRNPQRVAVSVQDRESQEIIFEEELPNAYISQVDMRFLGNVLLIATVQADEGQLEFRRRTVSSSYQVDNELFQDEVFSSWDAIKISPNGRYVLAFADDLVYALALETGTIYSLGQDVSRSSQWLPDEGASLFYLTDDGYGASGQVLSFNRGIEVDEQSIMNAYSFVLSPDSNYILYRVRHEEDDNDWLSLWLLNRGTGEVRELAQTNIYAADVQWLSPSQFAYTDNEPDIQSQSDIYLYDVNSRESRQISDTPEIDESFECMLG